MILLWLKNSKPASKLIRWGLEDDASHFALAFYDSPDKKRGLVTHHTFSGFNIDWLPEYLSRNEVVRSLKPKQDSRDLDRLLFRQVCDTYSPLEYDKPSFFYFCYRAALSRLMGKPLPTINDWNSGENVLCTGEAKILQDFNPKWFSKHFEDFDIVTPWMLFESLLNSNHFKEVLWQP